MKKLTLLFALAFAGFSQTALAQEAPRAELFGGYSYLRVRPGDGIDSIGAHGFTASIAGNVTRNFGLVAEFSRHSKSESINFSDLLNQPGLGTFGARVRAHTYLFGPRVTLRTGNLEPFAHALFGAANGRAEASGIGLAERESGTAFTYALGGGLDLKVHDNFAIRLGQLDYLRTRVSGEGLNSTRYSVGIVIRMGSR
jgi:hypothetical protein